MAEMNTDSGGGGKHKGGKKGPKKMSTRVDLTPMVDLAFLLITFFMLTTTLAKPQTMEINMPVKEDVPEGEESKVDKATVMQAVLGADDKVYYYFGMFDDAGSVTEMQVTDFGPEGLRKVILDFNRTNVQRIQELKNKLRGEIKDPEKFKSEFKKQANDIKGEKQAKMVLIKPSDDSRYKNMVDILDEMAITGIGKYAIVDVTPDELARVEAKKNNTTNQ